jgi:hypothetical protein
MCLSYNIRSMDVKKRSKAADIILGLLLWLERSLIAQSSPTASGL